MWIYLGNPSKLSLEIQSSTILLFNFNKNTIKVNIKAKIAEKWNKIL